MGRTKLLRGTEWGARGQLSSYYESESTFQDPSSHLISHREVPARVILVLLAKRIGIPFQRYFEVAAAAQLPSELQSGKFWNSYFPIFLYLNMFIQEHYLVSVSC